MNEYKYTDLYGNPIPKRCPVCNKPLDNPYGRQTYCSEKCRDKAQKERDREREDPRAFHKYPSRNESEIEEIDAIVMQPGSRYSSYGQYDVAQRAKAEEKIHVPKGFTSFEERKKENEP